MRTSSAPGSPQLGVGRGPDHARNWVALVDGNNQQIDRQPGDGDLPEHARKRSTVITLDGSACDTVGIPNLMNALLALSAEIEMILKQHARQLTTV